MRPEDELAFTEDMETILFKGFITRCVAWYHKPTKTLTQSDLLMNLPCTEVSEQVMKIIQYVLTPR